ncbi:partial 6-phospho-3-hexuloisomerase, partial [uncultured bacterium]
FDRIPFLTVHEISEATRASVASIVRFAQRIGYSGYSEVRDDIAETLQHHISNNHIFTLLDAKSQSKDILTTVANQDIKNINETISINERSTFKKAVDMIISARRVVTGGLGISHLLASILAYQLSQVAVDAQALTNNHATFKEQLLFLDKSDLFIAITFPPYSKQTVTAAEFAFNRGIKVLSVTNKNSSPITFFSDAFLIVKSENMLFTNSFSAVSVLINAIATQVALSNEEQAKAFLDDLEYLNTIDGDTLE